MSGLADQTGLRQPRLHVLKHMNDRLALPVEEICKPMHPRKTALLLQYIDPVILIIVGGGGGGGGAF